MAALYGLNERIALHSVVLALMTIAVFVRLYTRAIITKKVGLDDCKLFSTGVDVESAYLMPIDDQISVSQHGSGELRKLPTKSCWLISVLGLVLHILSLHGLRYVQCDMKLSTITH